MSSSVNRIRATETCRNWNKNFPIGTEVLLDGKRYKTWSHAAMGLKFEPGVFLDGIEELVPLSRLTVPGWNQTSKRG